jgi:ATP-dependent exoDNAse (exonuclease V) alpha subunit
MTTTVTTGVELTDEQVAAVEYCARGDREVVKLGGYAGVGKSVCVVELRRLLPGYAVCAYTGKAANVLRRKGIADACTIHSLIYKPHDVDGTTEWELRERHELFADGFIVDEASMVSAEIYRDLKTFGVPLVFVGDHGQLEPVGSGETGFCLMREPDVRLETIHRNAGEIARFAEHLRRGGEASDWRENAGQVSIITGDQLAGAGMERADQVLCAFNKTRVSINASFRECLGLPRGEPVVGDRVICLQNDREHGVFNGMQGVLTRIDPQRRRLSFEDEDGREYPNVRYNPEAFGAERAPKRALGVVPFDWAYCVTCHKMQGSEADSVLVLEQRCDLWEHKRWSYTAASRAKERLTWVLG